MDIQDVILQAKLGRYRKDAQIDTCAVFAAALYDVLKARGIACALYTAAYGCNYSSGAEWYHSVVKVGDRYFDSMGEFSLDIYRARARIHPKVKSRMDFKRDSRIGCYEEEFDEMHAFYVGKLGKAFDSAAQALTAQIKELPAIPDEAVVPEEAEASAACFRMG
jgi:hypothetical protein